MGVPSPVPRDDMPDVLGALRSVRIRHGGWDEVRIHTVLGEALAGGRVSARHEVRLGRLRLDFLTAGGTAIEVKKGRPPASPTLVQLRRYAARPEVARLVLVTERGLPEIPHELCGKPLAQVALWSSWGIAL